MWSLGKFGALASEPPVALEASRSRIDAETRSKTTSASHSWEAWTLIWEFPKSGALYRPQDSRALIIRTPIKRTPIFMETAIWALALSVGFGGGVQSMRVRTRGPIAWSTDGW